MRHAMAQERPESLKRTALVAENERGSRAPGLSAPPRIMLRSIARFLQRHRRRLSAAVAHPLRRALGDQAAEAESEALISSLRKALRKGHEGEFLDELKRASGRWAKRGVQHTECIEAMLALVRGTPSTETVVDATAISAVLDAAPGAVAHLDAEGRVIQANAAFVRATGTYDLAMPGTPIQDLLAPECHGVIRTLISGAGTAAAAPPLGRVRLEGSPEREWIAVAIPFVVDGAPEGALLALSADVPSMDTETSITSLLAREKRQSEKFAALLTVSHAVANSLELDTILKTIAKLVRQVIQTDECTVFLFDEEEQLLRPVVCDAQAFVGEMMAIRLKLGEGITGMVAQTGRGEIVHDAEADPRAVTVPGTPAEQTALLCVPLLSRERVLGVITLTRIGDRSFQDEDLELATLFAGQCAAAIANARLFEDMKAAFDQLRATQSQLVQSAKLNALGEMAGGVAHDFNNILAAILGRTQLLANQTSDPDVKRQLAVIEQAAIDGAQTVRRVQEFTRVRADERFRTLDVNQVLLDVLELTRPAWEASAKRRGIVIDVHLELAATQRMAGNDSELREVFTNLILNAVDAMPRGGDLWVASENGEDIVRVQVRDSGSGMDPETRMRIFDPFFTTKDVKGTGLGLSVAYGIVSRHHGQIGVESEMGVGTVCTLDFPVGEVEREIEEPPRVGPVPRQRMLVVDDEPSVLHVLVDLLSAMGHDVTPALGGPAGLEALARESFDVVFTDLGMPEVNGWDLADSAKRLHPRSAVVLVTGWGFQLEEDAAASRGVDRVLAKPFSWEDVEETLRQVAGDSSRPAAA